MLLNPYVFVAQPIHLFAIKPAVQLPCRFREAVCNSSKFSPSRPMCVVPAPHTRMITHDIGKPNVEKDSSQPGPST